MNSKPLSHFKKSQISKKIYSERNINYVSKKNKQIPKTYLRSFKNYKSNFKRKKKIILINPFLKKT